jgi:ribulose-5-phosphate 4-epimerase/fuculose-1-phosphate aldolase
MWRKKIYPEGSDGWHSEPARQWRERQYQAGEQAEGRVKFQDVCVRMIDPGSVLAGGIGDIDVYTELCSWLGLTPVDQYGTLGNVSRRINPSEITFDWQSELTRAFDAYNGAYRADDDIEERRRSLSRTLFLITGSGLDTKEEVTPGEFCLIIGVDWHTDPPTVYYVGNRKPSSEALAHARIYETDSAIDAIVHGHKEELKEQPYIRATDIQGDAKNLMGTRELADATAQLFIGYPDTVAGNWPGHGTFTVGRTPEPESEHTQALSESALSEAVINFVVLQIKYLVETAHTALLQRTPTGRREHGRLMQEANNLVTKLEIYEFFVRGIGPNLGISTFRDTLMRTLSHALFPRRTTNHVPPINETICRIAHAVQPDEKIDQHMRRARAILSGHISGRKMFAAYVPNFGLSEDLVIGLLSSLRDPQLRARAFSQASSRERRRTMLRGARIRSRMIAKLEPLFDFLDHREG